MFFLFTAFVSGMAVTVLELAATRLLAPHFGASLFVWTNVIGIILAGLAAGYAIGGRYADRAASPRTLYHFLGLAGIFAAVTPFCVRPVTAFVSATVAVSFAPSVLLIGSFFVAVALFFLPILLLGMTSPFLIAMTKRIHNGGVGTIAGRIFSWSTVGSIFGIFSTGLVFIPFFGTRKTILGAASALMLLGVFGAGKRWSVPLLCSLLLLFLPSSVFGSLLFSEGLLVEHESPYQYIRVNERDGRRYLIFNEGGGIQSLIDPTTLVTGFYYDYLAPFPLAFSKEQNLRILMLGLGGGTIPRTYNALFSDRPYTIDAVEIDASVIDIAREFFALPEDRLSIYHADGRMFAATTEATYDLIILDAFTHQYYIPPHMATEEFFSLLRARLAPGGIVVMNVDAVRESSPLLQSLGATAQRVFPWVTAIPMPNSWSFLLVAANEPVRPERFPQAIDDSFLAHTTAYLQEHLQRPLSNFSGVVLTDDRAPIELLTDAMFFQEVVSVQ